MTSDVLTTCDKYAHDMPETFTAKLAQLRSAYNIFDKELYGVRRLSAAGLLEAERARNYAVRKIYSLIVEYSDYEFDKEMEVAAKALLSVVKKYGTGRKISKMGQDTKTAVLIVLLKDLEKPDNQAHIETLKLGAPMFSLMVNNQTFEREQNERRKHLSNYVTDVVRDARIDLQVQFIEFVDVINALAIVEGPEKYADLKRKISSYVRDYARQARLRVKRKKVEP